MRSKKAFYNMATSLVLQLMAIIYGFVVPKIIIDYFGSDVNGLVASVTQFLAYITLLESGFGPVVKAMLYDVIAKRDHKAIAGILKTSEKFFRRIALAFVLYIIILCAAFPFIVGSDFNAIFTISLVVIIAISTFAEYFFGMTYRLFLQAEQKMYVVSIIQIVTYILSMIAVVILALAGQNILVIKLVSGLIFVVRPIVQNLYVKKKYNINLKDAPDNYPIKQKWEGLAQHIAAIIRDNTDVAVLTIFTTLVDVSIYSVYYLVISGIRRALLTLNSSLDASFGDMIAKKEDENLRKSFSAYELLYMIVITIIFACAFILITPFVAIYTEGVTDAEYIQPLFGYLLTLSGLSFVIMIPYCSLTLAAGHFRETRWGAWVEAGTNIIVSVALVVNFGLVGVAIGTVVAMSIRTAEFIYHTNKYILKRNIWCTIKKILISVVTIAVVAVFMQIFYHPNPTGYSEWIFDAFVIAAVAMVLIIAIYSIFCRKDMGIMVVQMKKILKHKKKKEIEDGI